MRLYAEHDRLPVDCWLDELFPSGKNRVSLVRGYSHLAPLEDGAALYWVFDDDYEVRYALAACLTEAEANAVYNADPHTTGMIEPVRSTMLNTRAWIGVDDGTSFRCQPFVIPCDGSETEFVDQMFCAVGVSDGTIVDTQGVRDFMAGHGVSSDWLFAEE